VPSSETEQRPKKPANPSQRIGEAKLSARRSGVNV
jgi:hypothetical protein